MNNDTKDYIIKEAYKLFLNNSYEAVSISDICAEIGLTKGALYHHFESKEALFIAVIDKYFIFPTTEFNINTITLKEFNEITIKNIEKIIFNICGDSKELVPVNYMSLISDCFRHYPGFKEKTIELLDLENNKTKNVFEVAMKRGEIRNDIDCSSVAEMYFSNCIGLAGNILRNNSIEEAIQMLRNQINDFYKLLKI